VTSAEEDEEEEARKEADEEEEEEEDELMGGLERVVNECVVELKTVGILMCRGSPRGLELAEEECGRVRKIPLSLSSRLNDDLPLTGVRETASLLNISAGKEEPPEDEDEEEEKGEEVSEEFRRWSMDPLR